MSAFGELEISGAGIFSSYLNKPEETFESFTEDGWFRTGDKVEIDEFGYIKIVDRIKSIICLSNGKNIAPAKNRKRALQLVPILNNFSVLEMNGASYPA